VNTHLKYTTKSILLKSTWMSLSLALTLLSGCTDYRNSFDCPPGPGVGCLSVTQIESMVVERDEGEDEFTGHQRRAHRRGGNRKKARTSDQPKDQSKKRRSKRKRAPSALPCGDLKCTEEEIPQIHLEEKRVWICDQGAWAGEYSDDKETQAALEGKALPKSILGSHQVPKDKAPSSDPEPDTPADDSPSGGYSYFTIESESTS